MLLGNLVQKIMAENQVDSLCSTMFDIIDKNKPITDKEWKATVNEIKKSIEGGIKNLPGEKVINKTMFYQWDKYMEGPDLPEYFKDCTEPLTYFNRYKVIYSSIRDKKEEKRRIDRNHVHTINKFDTSLLQSSPSAKSITRSDVENWTKDNSKCMDIIKSILCHLDTLTKFFLQQEKIQNFVELKKQELQKMGSNDSIDSQILQLEKLFPPIDVKVFFSAVMDSFIFLECRLQNYTKVQMMKNRKIQQNI